MRYKEKFYSTTLTSIALVFFIILVSSTALACSEQTASAYSEQNTSRVIPYAYVANRLDGTVSVIDTAKDKVIDTVPVGIGPFGVAVAETKKATKIYVAHYGGGETVSVFNTANRHDVKVVPPISNYFLSGEIAVSPNGTRAYVTGYNTHEYVVLVIDTNKDKFINTIPVGRSITPGTFNDEIPITVAETKMGTKIYLSNRFTGNVSVVDIANNTVNKTLPGFSATGIAASLDGKKVYVANSGNLGGYVSVIDTTTDKILPKEIPVGNNPRGIAVSPDGSKIYVANQDDGTVSVIDAATNNVTTCVSVGDNPFRIAVTPNGKKVYVTNQGLDTNFNGTVSVIDAVVNKVIDGEISVERMPTAVAVSRR